ncbi:DNA primase/polymerase [Mycobacterium phage Onyinye]|uniref:DNA primase/polymerase n=1 Tax=Mycobacterium phage Onyinye TaxID=2686235 RepID=A0A6B9L7K5_9CAUD|nr:DNA primase/polymerase [Mycobacterium phage Onyinye]QHB37510.1 DNA primase/polymerase [Mycobacterium phage Onyinye]
MSIRPYSDYSKKYREMGWLGTLPLPPREKNPPPTGFTGSGRPYPTDVQVRRWAKEQPDGNLALRLAEVPRERLKGRDDIPFIYAGNNVDGWELLGIDVDDYGDKHGRAELEALETELGPLPRTALSSARFDGWEEHRSAIRIFLVPQGFRFMGKAGPSIDIVQKRHRFMAAYPSYNPDAKSLYEWRFGATSDGLKDLELFEPEKPSYGLPDPGTDDVAILPESWFYHLSRGGQAETEDVISDLSDDELVDWMKTLRFEEPMCDQMRNGLERWLSRLDESASSHDKLVPAHYELVRLAAEGHAGLLEALNTFHPAWAAHANANSGRDPGEMMGEINRSIHGALDKTYPMLGKYHPEDKCAVDLSKFDTASWAVKFEDDRIAAGDYGGLGPVVGRMEILPAKPANEYGQHDDGNGQHFIDLYGGNVKFVDGRGSWVLWDGERWHQDQSDRLVSLAYRRVRMAQEDYAIATIAEGKDQDDKGLIAAGKSWLNWSKRSGNIAPIKAALESATRLYVNDGEQVAVPANIFDESKTLLGCANGVLELTDDPEVRPPRKEDYVTFNTHVPYIPWRQLANSEGETLDGYVLWCEYLDTFFPDKTLQRYIQKVMGHLIVGENPEKRIVFLYGPHDTGKSTMLGGLDGALGDYVDSAPDSLMRPKDLNPGLIKAVPLRVVHMSETDAATMDVATVKRLTGNDLVSAEAKYSNTIFTGRPQFTIVVAANNPPHIKNADEALEERLLVLPFMKTIEREARRYDRQDQITKHSGVAVLSWLVEGWKMYVKEGIEDQPPAVKKMQREVVAGLNPSQQFIAEMIEKAVDSEEGRRMLQRATAKAKEKGRFKPTVADMPKEWTPKASHVYELYKRWCIANGVDPVNHPELTKDLGLGRPQQRKLDGANVRCYPAMRLREMEAQGSGWRAK